MRSTKRIVTLGPTVEPVTVSELKRQLRIDGNDSDAELPGFIAAARDLAEQYCNRYWAECDVAIFFDRFPSGSYGFRVPVTDLISINGISYKDNLGQVNDIFVFTEDLDRQLIFTDWPIGFNLRIDITAGAEVVPGGVKAAILMIAADLYENRTAQSTVQIHKNPAAMMMLDPYREEMGL
jgi:uncharacterized phiE125 gp8 family phage protein